MEIRYSTVCDKGKSRKQNQDAVYARRGNEWGFFVVADGMGGHSEGARASSMIIDAYKSWLEEEAPGLGSRSVSDLFTELRSVLDLANKEIYEQTSYGEICGSTVVVLVVRKNDYILLSVGDSRCYELRKKLFGSSLVQLTCDEISDQPGAERGKLTNAVGVRASLRCNIMAGRVGQRHLFFLCTDGVYKACSDNELQGALKSITEDSLPDVGERIKDMVYEKGAKDNLSAIIISVVQ